MNKYVSLAILLAVLLAGCTALNNLAINVDAHDAVDRLQDRYNTCWTCPLPSTIHGGDEIQAIMRTGVKNVCNVSPKDLHTAIDLYTK